MNVSVGAPLRSLLASSSRGALLALLVLMVAAGLTEGGGLLLLVPLLDLLQGGGNASPLARHLQPLLHGLGLPLSAPLLLTAFVILVGASAGLQYARTVAATSLQLRWVDGLRTRAFATLLRAEYGWIAQQRQADQVNLLTIDINRVGAGMSSALGLLAMLATALIYVAAALALAPQPMLLLLASGALAWWWLLGQRRQAIELGHAQGRANRDVLAHVQETLAGLKLAKVLGAEAGLAAGFDAAVTSLREQQMRFQRSQARARALTQLAAAVFLAGFVGAGLAIWNTPLSELVMLALLLMRLVPMFSSAQQQWHLYLNSMPALAGIEALVRACEAAAEPTTISTALWLVAETIELKAVTLRRATRLSPVLRDASLALRARTTTAIVGTSGAGKTTLADVLAGLLVPDEGTLEVDGIVVDGGARARWRRSVAYVTQEVFLVHDTVRNNLRWGLPVDGDGRVDDARLAEVLHLAAAGFVLELPEGLDTIVGDGGLMLSGGERQRLALARALLRRPALLILDEATSALDIDNEARIGDAIRALRGNFTVLLIGHRLAMLEHADQVLVMEEGRILRDGIAAALRGNEPRNNESVHP